MISLKPQDHAKLMLCRRCGHSQVATPACVEFDRLHGYVLTLGSKFRFCDECDGEVDEVLWPAPASEPIQAGQRVLVNQSSGFHKGARGTVSYVEPSGTRVWVRRDGASSDCYFHRDELDPA